MNYLFAKLPEVLPKGVEHAEEGEVVIPAFPTEENINKFIGLNTFKYSYYAEVRKVAIDALDFINEVINRLVKYYPGVPMTIHTQYVTATERIASKLPIGTVVQVFITDDSATLKIRNKDELHVMWSKQPKE